MQLRISHSYNHIHVHVRVSCVYYISVKNKLTFSTIVSAADIKSLPWNWVIGIMNLAKYSAISIINGRI